MKRIVVLITFFALLPKIYSQDTITRLNFNIFLDGQFIESGINGNFLVKDTSNNTSFSCPFRYISDNIEIETKYYEKVKKLNKPIITMNFELNVRLLGEYTLLRSYSITINNYFFRGFVNIKIYNRESKMYRKYFKLKTDYIVDIKTDYGATTQRRYFKSKRRMKQFNKIECDNPLLRGSPHLE
jgi:hypothetical protein